MLRTIHTMEELDISGWMEVYREGHEENGAYFYPDEPPERKSQGKQPNRWQRKTTFGSKAMCTGQRRTRPISRKPIL